MGITLPAYSTSAKEIAGTSVLAEMTLDFPNYRYVILEESLCTPIKSEWVHETGAFEYSYIARLSEPLLMSVNAFDGTKGNTVAYMANYSIVRNVYDSNASSVSATDGNYGTYASFGADSITVQKKLTIRKPFYTMKGNSSYFSSADWARVTDIRMQHHYALYRVPADATYWDGWTANMCVEKMNNDIANGGTLT